MIRFSAIKSGAKYMISEQMSNKSVYNAEGEVPSTGQEATDALA